MYFELVFTRRNHVTKENKSERKYFLICLQMKHNGFLSFMRLPRQLHPCIKKRRRVLSTVFFSSNRFAMYIVQLFCSPSFLGASYKYLCGLSYSTLIFIEVIYLECSTRSHQSLTNRCCSFFYTRCKLVLGVSGVVFNFLFTIISGP